MFGKIMRRNMIIAVHFRVLNVYILQGIVLDLRISNFTCHFFTPT
jgi:hypothetical protein